MQALAHFKRNELEMESFVETSNENRKIRDGRACLLDGILQRMKELNGCLMLYHKTWLKISDLDRKYKTHHETSG